MTTLVWLRQDLRLADNPALRAAAKGGGPVVPVFLWAPEEEGDWPAGAASRWWLHQSLTALDADLRKHRSRLIIRRGPSADALLTLAREVKAAAIVWARRHEPAVVERDERVAAALCAAGLRVETFNAALLFEPGTIRTRQGKPYQVYTPFWRACRAAAAPAAPLPAPRTLGAPAKWPVSLAPAELGLEPRIDWAGGLRDAWRPGEAGARQRLRAFLDAASDYAVARDRPGRAGTSSLSPHLHFGEISPRTVWHAVHERFPSGGALPRGPEVFLKELAWREFAHHLLHHFPHTAGQPLRAAFARFGWRDDPAALRAWQRGRTGYPFVDAAMRQLWHTGWMHNRARMVTASFLVKDLLLPWREGARWFWDTLVDADLANNTLGWQWVAGCGADAAPFFRVFNPVEQGKKFDPAGDYVRRWVPEVAHLPTEVIHQPWRADVALGGNYPPPIVDHAAARHRALAALAALRQADD